MTSFLTPRAMSLLATCGQHAQSPPCVAQLVGFALLHAGVKAMAAPCGGRPCFSALALSAATSATFFANLSAASFASVPELQRNAF